jgi:hypothetical protein
MPTKKLIIPRSLSFLEKNRNVLEKPVECIRKKGKKNEISPNLKMDGEPIQTYQSSWSTQSKREYLLELARRNRKRRGLPKRETQFPVVKTIANVYPKGTTRG